MDTKELRPGNNVIYKPTSDIVTVLYAGPKEWAFETTWEWNESAQEELQEIEWLSMEAAEPIPLTPEILEAAGFEMYEDKTWRHPSTMLFELRNIGKSTGAFRIVAGWFVDDRRMFKGCSTEIHSLHRLQNVFYFLTGSELQIDLIKVKA